MKTRWMAKTKEERGKHRLAKRLFRGAQRGAKRAGKKDPVVRRWLISQLTGKTPDTWVWGRA